MAGTRKAKDAVTAPSNPTAFTAETRNGMTFTYEETEAPARTESAAQPNPHDAGIARANVLRTEKPGTALKVTVPTSDLPKHLTWLRKGANALGYTMKCSVQSDEKTEQSVVTFWGVDKIDRPRKEKVTPDVSNAEKADADKTAGF